MNAKKLLGLPATSAISLIGGVSAVTIWLILHGMTWHYAFLQQMDQLYGHQTSSFLLPLPYPFDLFFFLLIPTLGALLAATMLLRAFHIGGAFAISLFGVAIIHSAGAIFGDIQTAANGTGWHYWLKMIAILLIVGLSAFGVGYCLKQLLSTRRLIIIAIIISVVSTATIFTLAVSSNHILLQP